MFEPSRNWHRLELAPINLAIGSCSRTHAAHNASALKNRRARRWSRDSVHDMFYRLDEATGNVGVRSCQALFWRLAMATEMDVVQLAARVMEQRGHRVTRHDTWLEHCDSGIAIRPLLLESRPANSSVLSISTVSTQHPRLAPAGIFEYQHAIGATLSEAFCDGFDQWLQIDFVVLLDALQDRAGHCMTLNWTFPRVGAPEVARRAVLGPVGHAVAQPERRSCEIVEHPFCPCCLLTNTYETFRPFIEDEGFYGIRLFAARDDDGSTQADCRINGMDWDQGTRALCAYADTWPRAGFEVRKQYIVLQTLSS